MRATPRARSAPSSPRAARPKEPPSAGCGRGVPQDREEWQAICVQAAAREAAGVVVGAEEILLDLLRNPNPRGDRRDLNVASG